MTGASIFHYHKEMEKNKRAEKIYECKNISLEFFNCKLKKNNCKNYYDKLIKCINDINKIDF